MSIIIIIILGLQINNLLICLLILHYNGASGVGTDDVSVMEGDSVTLHTDVKTNQQEEVVWYFNDTRIAQISDYLSKTCTDVQCNKGTERFRGRLKLDHQTGSLTIRDITNTDSGDYKLVTISSKSSSSKISRLAVHGVSAAQQDKKNTKSVVEGESVTLDAGSTKNPNDSMAWFFNDTIIAEITGDQSKICTDDQCKERFRDRLKLDHQTGSLTIMNTRTTDSGDYHLQINSSSIHSRRHSIGVTSFKSFSVSVSAVPDSGLSPAAVGGICGVLLLVVCAVAGVLAKSKGICMLQNNQENYEL